MADSWNTKTAMPAGRSHAGTVGVNDDKLHAVGGVNGGGATDTHWQYSASANSWVSKALYGTTWATNPVSWGDETFENFNSDGQANINRLYSLSSDTWTTKANMLAGRKYYGAASLGSDAFVYGGGDPVISNNERYNKASDAWSTKTALISARTKMGSFAIGSDKCYCSGQDLGSANTHWEYSFAGDNWTVKAVIPANRGRMASAGVGNNNGFLGGGYSGTAYTNTNYEYTQNTNVWATKSALPVTASGENGGANLGTASYHVLGSNQTGQQAQNLQYLAYDLEALEDLKTELVGDWPTALEDLKADLRAYAWAYEYLKTELVGTTLDALEDLKTEIAGNAWGYEDLKAELVGYGQALEDLKCELVSNLYSFEDLKCELRAADRDNPYVVLAGLSPTPGQSAVLIGSNIVVKIRDDGWGVNVNQCWVDVREIITDGYGGELSSTTTRYKQGVTGFSYQLSSDKRECIITIDPQTDFGYNRKLEVKVFAVDLAGNCGTTGR